MEPTLFSKYFPNSANPDYHEQLSHTLTSDSNECAICLESMDFKSATVIEACRHLFCTQCILRCDKCPLCRGSILSTSIRSREQVTLAIALIGLTSELRIIDKISIFSPREDILKRVFGSDGVTVRKVCVKGSFEFVENATLVDYEVLPSSERILMWIFYS